MLIAAQLRRLWFELDAYDRTMESIGDDFAESSHIEASGDDLLERIRAMETVLMHFRPTTSLEAAIIATVHADRAAVTEHDYLDPPLTRDHRNPRLPAQLADASTLEARAVPGELGRAAAALRDYLLDKSGSDDLGLRGFFESCPGVITERTTSQGNAPRDHDAAAGAAELLARLEADCLAAYDEHGGLVRARAETEDSAQTARREMRMRELAGFIDALEDAIAALTLGRRNANRARFELARRASS
ncbi:MAG: hypothetical protein K8F92_14745 [Hyphomicrobium sp.]|uniref:hypothetical protein n=1 Tax=Hyphomicrobium sp. TaxID=82 RepID=UPI0013253204|nr:hypothetical protein [Hyphomicrobium sp.]KAB2942937.1 MAG: hypothetical protein F9K20_05605 [Hyphomicrobium sp.]MBZ0210890.1 hypothetical protein [Hyphomicrobium sp.]